MTRLSAVVALLLLAACPKSETTPPTTPEGGGGGDPTVGPDAKQDVVEDPEPDDSKLHPVTVFGVQCRAGLDKARKKLDEVLAVEGDRTMENTLVAYDEMIMHLEESWGIGLLWRNVHPDEAIRDEAGACEQEAANFASALALNRELYDALSALDTSKYDAEAKRLVTKTLEDFRRAGVDRDEETRNKIKELDDAIIKAAQAFSNAMKEDIRQIEVDSADDLKGLPQDYIDEHKPNEDGKIVITTRYPDYFPVATFAESPDVKKRIYVAARTRGDDKKDLLKKVLELRWEKAKLLGYRDFADYYIEDKMMKSGKAAHNFIQRVAKLARKRSRADYRAMLKRKKKDDPKAKKVGDWEKTYYETLIKKEKYAFDAQEVRQYFPYDAVENGVLEITGEMFDVQYEPVEDDRVWHEDVKVFDVMQDGEKIGRIFLDMHPRDGKYTHAAQFPLTPGVKGKSLPEGALVCNFPKTLMMHGQVETMFHEFGHLMHHTFKGGRTWMALGETERDFVEAPSQIFEEWAWDYEVLKRFAKHHETGEVIPKDLVERMRKSKEFGIGYSTAYQMYYAAMILNFYRTDPAKLDMDDENKRLMETMTPFDHVEGTNRYMQIGQVVGYPASYYTYMWSLVLAKDLFTPFEKHGLLNKEWTLKYRDKVLAMGGAKPAEQLIKDFLGRKWSYKAFEKYLRK